MISSRRILSGCAFALIVWVGGCDRVNQDKHMAAGATLPTMRTHCIGRFLIDLPEDFKQTLGSEVELIYGLDKDFQKVGVKVLRASGIQPSFDSFVQKRAAELASQQHFEATSKTMLALQQRIDSNSVLVRAFFSPRMLDSYRSEMYRQVGNAVGLFTKRVYTGKSAEAVEAKLIRVVENTIFIQNPAQAGRGTCLGPLLIDAGQDGEWFSVRFDTDRMPDVLIEIDINSLLAKSDGGLLKRIDSKADMLAKLDFKSDTLRRGKTTIAGQPSEELLSKGEERGHTVRGFTAESLLLTPATFSAPSIAITMNMGGLLDGGKYYNASMTEPEAIALWDAIVKSIRLRPGAV